MCIVCFTHNLLNNHFKGVIRQFKTPLVEYVSKLTSFDPGDRGRNTFSIDICVRSKQSNQKS